MYGRIIDMNSTDAYISFEDGTTMYVGKSHIPKNYKVGDRVDINVTNSATIMINDKLNNIM